MIQIRNPFNIFVKLKNSNCFKIKAYFFKYFSFSISFIRIFPLPQFPSSVLQFFYKRNQTHIFSTEIGTDNRTVFVAFLFGYVILL